MVKKKLKKGLALVLAFTMAMPLHTIAKNENEDTDWKLIWCDEFEGNALDTSKWSCQIGNGYNGWGNNESQYYTQENVSVSDGTLKITAKKENKEDFQYTSSRIRTVTDDGKTLFATKYGKVEARIKLPSGAGLWPAFWMMPVDNEYGSWPLSGEIDIMEARGRVLNTINGTIHFGEERPFNKHMGSSYVFQDGTNITDYHVYGVEWNENTIIWYVDGIEYYRTSNWYTMKDGVVAEYPAPFNQEFYIILNMAVGGNYDNFTLPTDDVLPGTMEVDYVRVYHKSQGYDDKNVEMPVGTRDDAAMAATPVFEDGNLLADKNFETLNESIMYSDEPDYGTHNWFFVNNRYFFGNATVSKVCKDDKVYAKIKILDPGTESYSVQLKQLLPLAKGYVYKVTFEAMSLDGERTIKAKTAGGSDRGYANYNDSFTGNLTNELKEYEFSFIMQDETDMNAMIEFNVGKHSGEVMIGNVMVTVVDTYNKVNSEENIETVQTPKASVAGGSYEAVQTVALSTKTEGAAIYYTTDGSEPNITNSQKYESALTIDKSLTLKAMAVKSGMKDSEIMTEQYTISLPENKDETGDKDETGKQNETATTVEEAEEKITSTNTDEEDVAGSKFSSLRLEATGKNKSVKLTWKKVKDADGYIIYGSGCGKSMKKIKTLKGNTKVTYTQKKLAKGKSYKYIVVAYKNVDGKKCIIATSKSAHAVTTGGKYGNPTKVSVQSAKITLKAGKKKTIKASYTLPIGKKAGIHISKFRYESTNTKVATVSKKGVVKAKKKGTAYIYVYAQNGVYKKVKVTVK